MKLQLFGILSGESFEILEDSTEVAPRGNIHIQRLKTDPNCRDWFSGALIEVLIRMESRDFAVIWFLQLRAIRKQRGSQVSLARVIFCVIKGKNSEISRWPLIEISGNNYCESVVNIRREIVLRLVGYKTGSRICVSTHLITFAEFQSNKSPLFSLFKLLGFSFFWFSSVFGGEMGQSNLVSQGSQETNTATTLKIKIKVPRFDNSALIEGYSKTLIGRCMNPAMQDMKALLFMLPRIWKLEDRVAGADLGLGRFQFDFEHEEDIHEIMKMEPFHFDHWMLSLVRWEPVVDRRYPFVIKFWVRMMGVPLHFWADETFRSIGSDLGDVQEVDLDNGRVQVIVDGFKPLVFEAAVEFHNGEETMVSLRYERLFGFCRRCHSLCHDQMRCTTNGDKGKQKMDNLPEDPKVDDKLQSYKGAITSGLFSGNTTDSRGIGSGSVASAHDSHAVHRKSAASQEGNHRSKSGYGNSFKKGRRNPFVAPSNGSTSQMAVPVNGLNQLRTESTGKGFTDHEQKMLDAFLGSDPEKVVTDSDALRSNAEGSTMLAVVPSPAKTARKNLFSGAEGATGEEMDGASMELPQQHDLFPDDLSQLLAQDFPISGDSSLAFMDTIMEEKEDAIEGTHDEGTLKEELNGVNDTIVVTRSAPVSAFEEVSQDQHNSEVSEDQPHGDEEVVDTEPPAKKKIVRNKAVLPGISTRKRNLTSPRKRLVGKNAGPSVGNGSLQGEKHPPKQVSE